MRRRYGASHATLASPWHNTGQQTSKTWATVGELGALLLSEKGIGHVLEKTFQKPPPIAFMLADMPARTLQMMVRRAFPLGCPHATSKAGARNPHLLSCSPSETIMIIVW
jgi:hypothetical protein